VYPMVGSGQMCTWAHYDGETPIKYEIHPDSVALSFGRGELELAFSEAALEKLVGVSEAALREMRTTSAS